MYLLLLLLFLQLFLHCKCVLPPYLPILANNNFERGDLIEQYFHLGLGYSEISLSHGRYFRQFWGTATFTSESLHTARCNSLYL